MYRFVMLIAAVVSCAVFASPALAQAEAADDAGRAGIVSQRPPLFEDYIYTGQAEAYARDGWAFVRANPESNFSPGVVTNIYMLGQFANNEGLVTEMRRVLLFNYSRSFHAQHLIKTFPGDAELRKVVLADMQKDFMTRPEGFAERLTSLARAMIKQRGSKVMDDDQLLLIAAVAADIANDQELADAMARANRQRQGEGDLQAIRAIALQDNADNVGRLKALMPYSDNGTARMLSRMYLLTLDEKQRVEPDVLRATAAVVLFDRRFADAVSLIERIDAADRSDRDLFWIAWSQIATGQDEEATKTVAVLRERFPDSPWTGKATQLHGYLDGMEDRMREYATFIASLANSLGTGAAAIELRGSTTQAGQDTAIEFYLGAVRGKRLDLQLRRGDKVTLAYRDSLEAAELFTENADQIIAFDRGGMLPEITLSLVGSPQSGFTMQTGFRVGDNVDAQKPYFGELVASPYLSNVEGVLDLLRYQRSQGRLVVPTTQHGGGTVLGWAMPGILEPEISVSTITLTDGRLTAMQAGSLRIERIRYSVKDDLELSPPAMPDMPRTEPRPMVFTTAMQVFGEFVRVLTAGPSLSR